MGRVKGKKERQKKGWGGGGGGGGIKVKWEEREGYICIFIVTGMKERRWMKNGS